MRVLRAAVDLAAADVGEDQLAVARVFGDQPLHLGDRRPVGATVIEGEALSVHLRAEEALSGVRDEGPRSVVRATMEEKRSDPFDLTSVEDTGLDHSVLTQMDDADDHRRQPRPLVSLCRPVDLAAALADPCETASARIPLGDRVGRDEAQGPAAAELGEHPAEEVGDQVHL